MTFAFTLIAAAVLSVGTERVTCVPNGTGTCARIVFGLENGRTEVVRMTAEGVVRRLPADYAGHKAKTNFTFEDAALCLRGFWKEEIWSRPNPSRLWANKAIPEACVKVLDAWESYPAASRSRTVFDFVDRPDGGWSVYVNGSYDRELTHNAKGVRLVSKRFEIPEGWSHTEEKGVPLDPEARYQCCDFSLNSRAGTFRGACLEGLKPGRAEFGGVPIAVASPDEAGDVGIAKLVQGVFALEVNPYYLRAPRDAYPFEVHFRLKSADFTKAHLLVAVDDDAAKTKEMTVRLGHYLSDHGGSGANMWVDAKVVWDEKAKKVGTVVRNGRRYDIRYLTVPLDAGRIADIAAEFDYLDLDFLGEKSAFTVFGATLEAFPAKVAFVQGKSSPGNVFTADEPKASRVTSVRLTAREPCRGEVKWTARDDSGKVVFTGKAGYDFARRGDESTVGIPLGEAEAVGLYSLDIDFGPFVHPARFCVLPPAERSVPSEKCVYGTSDFFAHAVPTNLAVVSALHRKAGILKMSAWPWTRKFADAPTDLSPHGQVLLLSQKRSKFDAATGKFGVGEEAVVKDLQKQIRALPFADTVLIWHETEPRLPGYGPPEELLGTEIPAASDEAVAAAKYLNACGRIIRTHFPGMKIQVGNSSSSMGAATLPFRGGANADYYDRIGIEIPGQSFMPERACGLNAMLQTQAAAERHAKRKIPLNGCSEFTYRQVRSLGEPTQAAFYMRDILISLVNRFSLVNPAVLIDTRNAYYATFWGASGLCLRAPVCYPKIAYLAYAVLTRALDGAEFTRLRETGSPTIYAAEFKRADGRLATAFWCARGEATAELKPGEAEEAVSMRGKPLDLQRVRFGQEPSYVVSSRPLSDFRVGERAFARGERLFRDCKDRIALSTSVLTNAPGRAITSNAKRSPPVFLAGDAAVRDVKGPAGENGIEIAFDMTRTNCLYKNTFDTSTLLFREPVPLDPSADVIGVRLKGDSNWGQVYFIVEDANGREFKSYWHWVDCFMTDWAGNACVNFDGWGYVYYPMQTTDLIFDERTGEAKRLWRGAKGVKGEITWPLKLKGIVVAHARFPFGLLGYGKPYERPTVTLESVFTR